MTGTTVNYGFRIPNADGSDYQVPDDIIQPVTQIDARIKIVYDKLNGSVDALDNSVWASAPLGTGTTKWTNGSGYQLTQVMFKRQLDICQARIQLKRTGATIKAGNITNDDMCVMPIAHKPSNQNGVMNGGAAGGLAAGNVDSNGTVWLTATGSDIVLNGNYTFNIFWFAA